MKLISKAKDPLLDAFGKTNPTSQKAFACLAVGDVDIARRVSLAEY